MKKYGIILFLTALVVPSVAKAAWWDSWIWFMQNPKNIEQAVVKVPPSNTSPQVLNAAGPTISFTLVIRPMDKISD